MLKKLSKYNNDYFVIMHFRTKEVKCWLQPDLLSAYVTFRFLLFS